MYFFRDVLVSAFFWYRFSFRYFLVEFSLHNFLLASMQRWLGMGFASGFVGGFFLRFLGKRNHVNDFSAEI